jgi:hypothetical protein
MARASPAGIFWTVFWPAKAADDEASRRDGTSALAAASIVTKRTVTAKRYLLVR